MKTYFDQSALARDSLINEVDIIHPLCNVHFNLLNTIIENIFISISLSASARQSYLLDNFSISISISNHAKKVYK